MYQYKEIYTLDFSEVNYIKKLPDKPATHIFMQLESDTQFEAKVIDTLDIECTVLI